MYCICIDRQIDMHVVSYYYHPQTPFLSFHYE